MSLSERDLREVELLRRTLEASQSASIDLSALVSNVEALIQEIEGISDERRGSLRSEWGTLEQVFAMALDTRERGGSYRDYVAEHQQWVDESVANLLDMLAKLEAEELP